MEVVQIAYDDVDMNNGVIEEFDELSSYVHIPLTVDEKINVGGHPFMNSIVGVIGLLINMCALLSFFKTNSNFTLTKFEELCTLVVPIISGNARSMGEACDVSGCPVNRWNGF